MCTITTVVAIEFLVDMSVAVSYTVLLFQIQCTIGLVLNFCFHLTSVKTNKQTKPDPINISLVCLVYTQYIYLNLMIHFFHTYNKLQFPVRIHINFNIFQAHICLKVAYKYK